MNGHHSSKLIRATVFAVSLCLSALPAAAQSADGARWQQSGFDDDNGLRTHTLTFGIPETDAWALDASCKVGTKGPGIPVMLALDFGSRKDGDSVEVRFSSGSYEATFAGTVSIENDEYAGINVVIGDQDAFWDAIRQGDQLDYALVGAEPRSISLRGSNAPVRRFLASCQKAFEASDAAAAPAPEGPFAYRCEDGSSFNLTFDNSKSYSVVTISNGANSAQLVQVVSASGTLYSNGAVEMHTKGDEAVMTTPQNSVTCRRQP